MIDWLCPLYSMIASLVWFDWSIASLVWFDGSVASLVWFDWSVASLLVLDWSIAVWTRQIDPPLWWKWYPVSRPRGQSGVVWLIECLLAVIWLINCFPLLGPGRQTDVALLPAVLLLRAEYWRQDSERVPASLLPGRCLAHLEQVRITRHGQILIGQLHEVETYPQHSIGGCLLFFCIQSSQRMLMWLRTIFFHQISIYLFNTGLKFANNVVKNASF